ncbi:MAG TPA: tannase/feruloyl esterase family alpha/beta hydrolase [Gammaproteobacteria bacterium]|nr:tannase/feruloyl esterase family alpha/beta hydrolase [Gammaproteobacteria bacterium]
MRRPLLAAAVAAVVQSSLLLSAANAQPFANAKASRAQYLGSTARASGQCEQLNVRGIADAVEVSARNVAAEGNTPQHCRVSGVLSPEIAFEVALPAMWNGRLYMIGNGGHAGDALDNPGRVAQVRQGLENGFAVAQTNTGHYASKEPGATFVLSNPQKAIDYAYRAVHLTAVTAKEIANRYYAQPVAKAYWNSCSNGGRQGLLEAQRYPEDFDGIVANAPWVDQTGFTIGAIWNQRAFAETHVSADKLALVGSRVMEVCDAVDGLRDGLIDDPRQCKFNVARDVPSCSGSNAAGMCLTPAEAAAVQKVYDGPQSGGRQIFPGFMVGSEAVLPRPNGPATSGWVGLIAPAEAGQRPADFGLAEATMRYLVLRPPQAEWDFMKFDFSRDPSSLARWGEQANATDTDLRDFRARGGKLLMTYGWADAILQPLMGVNYYEKAVAANGANGTDFLRLFMIPGMAHCGGGLGPDQYDAVTAVVDWVEKGVAPDSMIASKIVNGTVTRSRPLCPYPQVARYKGQGSIDEAATFECKAP